MRSLKTLKILSAFTLGSTIGLAAGPALAQQAVQGQGATLPAGLYLDWFAPSPTTGFSYTYNAARAGTAALTGSGAGKNSFTSHSFNNLGTDRDVQFAGSDAILTSADISTYTTNNSAKYGDPIQLPSVGTPIVIAYNPTGLTRTRQGPTGLVSSTGTQSTGPIIYLSRRSYCGIFTGQITNWNDPRIIADNAVAPSTQPIKVVVRSDGDGATEIFTRHLDTVCDGSATAGGFSFFDTRKLADLSNAAVPPLGRTGGTTATGDNVVNWETIIDQGRTPSRVIRAAGDGGVSTAIANNQFAIGYVSPDYTNLVATPAASSGSPAPVPANLQNQSDLTAGTVSYAHSPAYPNVVAGQSGLPAPALTDSALLWGQKLNLRQGGSTPTSVDVRNNPTATTAYPIRGFTFLDFYTCYPAAKRDGLRGLIVYFTTTNRQTSTGIIEAPADITAKVHGFAPLPSAIKNQVRARGNATGTAPRGVSSGPIGGVCTL